MSYESHMANRTEAYRLDKRHFLAGRHVRWQHSIPGDGHIERAIKGLVGRNSHTPF